MKQEAIKTKPPAMKRINTRIREDQYIFIKIRAKETERTEGEVFRNLLDKFIKQLSK